MSMNGTKSSGKPSPGFGTYCQMPCTQSGPLSILRVARPDLTQMRTLRLHLPCNDHTTRRRHMCPPVPDVATTCDSLGRSAPNTTHRSRKPKRMSRAFQCVYTRTRTRSPTRTHRGQVVPPRRLAEIERLPVGDGLPPRLHNVRVLPLLAHVEAKVALRCGHLLLPRSPSVLKNRLHVLRHLEDLPVDEAGLGSRRLCICGALCVCLSCRGGNRGLWRR